jgi:hypothetical protein
MILLIALLLACTMVFLVTAVTAPVIEPTLAENVESYVRVKTLYNKR